MARLREQVERILRNTTPTQANTLPRLWSETWANIESGRA
jgi:hypothetical protein